MYESKRLARLGLRGLNNLQKKVAEAVKKAEFEQKIARIKNGDV